MVDTNGEMGEFAVDVMNGTVNKPAQSYFQQPKSMSAKAIAKAFLPSSDKLQDTSTALSLAAVASAEAPVVALALAGGALAVTLVDIAVNSDNQGADLAIEVIGASAEVTVGNKLKTLKAIVGSLPKGQKIVDAVVGYIASDAVKEEFKKLKDEK